MAGQRLSRQRHCLSHYDLYVVIDVSTGTLRGRKKRRRDTRCPALPPARATEADHHGALHAAVGRPAVQHCLEGFNVAVIAYGQTGAGKTHSMIGVLPAAGSPAPRAMADDPASQAGLAPRVFGALFEGLGQQRSEGGRSVSTNRPAGLAQHCPSFLLCLVPADGRRHCTVRDVNIRPALRRVQQLVSFTQSRQVELNCDWRWPLTQSACHRLRRT